MPHINSSFSNIQVVGVMGKAMQAVSPGLISSVLKCAQRTDIPLSNQKSAIQALRLMDINDEVQKLETGIQLECMHIFIHILPGCSLALVTISCLNFIIRLITDQKRPQEGIQGLPEPC